MPVTARSSFEVELEGEVAAVGRRGIGLKKEIALTGSLGGE